MTDKVSITICGDGGCGKSSITLRLVRSQWTHDYDPTIEDSYSVTRHIDGLPYLLSLTDTAGQEEYRGLWAASNLSSDAFLLVYDITQPASLENLQYFLDMIDIEAEHREEANRRIIREHRGKRGHPRGLRAAPVKIVAGNKCDLKDARQVSSRIGLEWARTRGCGFMETSAREMVNVEESFALIVRRVVEARRTMTGQPRIGANPSLTISNSSATGPHQSPTSANSQQPLVGGFGGVNSYQPVERSQLQDDLRKAPSPPSTMMRYNEKSGFDHGKAKMTVAKRLKRWLTCGCFR